MMNQVEGDVASEGKGGISDAQAKIEGPFNMKKLWIYEHVNREDWKWPIYDQWRSPETGKKERKLRATEMEEEAAANEDKLDGPPFQLTYRQDETEPDRLIVKLFSAHLIQMAKKCMPTQEQYFSIEKPKIDARDMFIALQSFREERDSIEQEFRLHQPTDQELNHEANARYWHSKHLLRFLESHFKDTIAEVQKMRQERTVTFDMLWAFLYKREKVSYTCRMTGRKLQGIVNMIYIKETKGEKRCKVDLEIRAYNGWKYVASTVKFTVFEFKSKSSFNSIGICPLSLLSDESRAELEVLFLRNGRKFYDIVTRRNTYMQYEGPRMYMRYKGKRSREHEKQKADGRVMVDLLAFATVKPNYELGDAQPPNKLNSLQHIHSEDREERPSDEELKLAPAVVYGFSFSNKAWGGFDVNGLSDIQFDEEAFDRDLVLSDPDKKAIILSLVEQYVKDSSANDMMMPKIDPISNKGDGCIFLCYGPPGTGKTLTAEAIAEKLHCPLWSVSVFELGVTIDSLEANLMEVLEISSQWRAILLIDEADVYLEKRASNADPNRTAMTAIFLRLLEYYRGVLFLTTNRVASFDDAFCSRISMFLRFHQLTDAQKKQIWGNLLSRAKVQNPDLAILSENDRDLNGREIRNCVRTAQTWARSRGEELTTDHVLKMVKMLGEFRRDLEGAIQEETAGGSITRARERVSTKSYSELACSQSSSMRTVSIM